MPKKRDNKRGRDKETMGLFAKENTENKELREALGRMAEQIKAVGGQFTFKIVIDNEGWTARCKEFDGIVTGGTNQNPSEEEVMQSLINAIKTAFHVPISNLEVKEAESENEKLEKFPPIKIVREREFQFS